MARNTEENGSSASTGAASHSEWEPTDADADFLCETFPGAEISYSHSRPVAGGWDQAFTDAARVIESAAGEQVANRLGRRDQVDAHLIPLLRTYQEGDLFAETVVNRAIGADLAAFLARIGPTERSTIGIEYVMRNRVGTPGQETAIYAEAYHNLRTGLDVAVREDVESRMFTLTHPSKLGASALCLPDFYEQTRSWLGQDEVFVAFTDPSHLSVTLPDSPFAHKLILAIEQSDYRGAVTLTPACYILDGDGLRRVAARSTTA